MSVKRSLGADEGKSQEISDELLGRLEDMETEQEAFVLADEIASMYKTIGFYEERREKLKAIPNFWPRVIQNDGLFANLYGHQHDDLDAIKYLEDVWITRDKPDPRAFAIELHFKENPYFTNKVIKKSYKLKKPPTGKLLYGIPEGMLLFSPERDLEITGTKIEWRNDKVNLSKKYPRNSGSKDISDPDLGSFFTFFELPEDDIEYGAHLANVVFANPIPHFKGEVDESDEDDDMSSSEDDDSAAEEIDLEEERPRKRTKRA